MAQPIDYKNYDGKRMQATPVHCFAKCMFNFFSCGTAECCPFQFTLKVENDDEIVFVDNTYCMCLKPTPCPCLPFCGYGPCEQKPRFKRSPDGTKFIGTGDSLWAGGCCKALFHNKDDVIEWNKDIDGSSKEKATPWIASTTNSNYPPCIRGKTIAAAFFVDKYAGAPEAEGMDR